MSESNKVPNEIWLEQDSKGIRPKWQAEPRNRRFGLAHTNIKFVPASQVEAQLEQARKDVWDKAIEEVGKTRLRLWREYTDSQTVLLNMVVGRVVKDLEAARTTDKPTTDRENVDAK